MLSEGGTLLWSSITGVDSNVLARSHNYIKRLLVSPCLSFCLTACSNSTPTGWMFMESYI